MTTSESNAMRPPAFTYRGHIDPLAKPSIPPTSWFITHTLGGLAKGMYTEVRFECSVDGHSYEFLGRVVRKVAEDLYGRGWAFHYPPDQYESAIQNERWSLTCREIVVVTDIEVWE